MRSAARSLLPTIAIGVILLGAAYRLRSAVVSQAPPAAPSAAASGAPGAAASGAQKASRPEGAPRGGCAGSAPP